MENTYKTLANSLENTYNKCSAGLQPERFSLYIRNTYFQEHLFSECLLFIFLLLFFTATDKHSTLIER